MSASLRKIGVILSVLIALPLIFAVAYELNSLNENERVIVEVYGEQLESILYSVNQYGDDAARVWVQRAVEAHQNNDTAQMSQLLNEQQAIKYVVLQAGDDLNVYTRTGWDNDWSNPLVDAYPSEYKKLITYRKAGYQKILPIPLADTSSEGLLFLPQTSPEPDEPEVYGLLVVDPQVFVSQVLAPRIQSATQEKFMVAIQDSQETEVLYQTEAFAEILPQRTNEIWLMPGYEMGIWLNGTTIDSLVKQRSTNNLLLIVGLEMLLLIGVLVVFRSIRKEMDLAQAKSDFVSNVSHEIRTPLALISMFAETLQMGRVRTEKKKQEYYRIISQESQRLSGMVNKILNFSKMEAGKREYQFEPKGMNEWVEGVLETYRFHLQQKGFSLDTDLAEDLPTVNMDREAATESLINLLDNAIKYSEEDKRLLLTTGRQNGRVFVELKDHGMGIPKEAQAAVFDKFYRVGSAEVHNTKGTGLGLSLVQHIMNAHGGNVELRQSAPGKGSTFRLNFVPADV
ncbi:MAG: HAMP domain-containing sensor histidine kinase [Bacteroidota bacterium]